MNNRFEEFLRLHRGDEPLLIANVWNNQSAGVFQRLGFKALATSSASVAESLGFEDGEQMSFDDYRSVVRHLTRTVKVPLSVDLEGGYGISAEVIADNIMSLLALGVCGVNIEDSVIMDGKRIISNSREFAEKIQRITNLLQQQNAKVFINIRCDAFLLGLSDASKEAAARAKIYQETGVHGLFFPCITAIEDIKAICGKSALPVNVMCMPGLPGFDQLHESGVKRISMGPFLSQSTYRNLESTTQKILSDRSFASLFQNPTK